MSTMPHWYMMNRMSLLYFQAMMGVRCFAFLLPKRSEHGVRSLLIYIVGFIASYYNALLLYSIGQAGLLQSAGRLLSMMLLYLMVVGSTWLLYETSGWGALFVASSGYAAQQIAGSIKGLLGLLPMVTAWANTGVWMLVFDVVCYGGTYLLLMGLFKPYILRGTDTFDDKLKAGFSFAVLVLCTVMARMTQDNPLRNELSQATESLYAIVCSVMVLLLQFGTMERAKLSHDVDSMRELVHQQHNQYVTSREMTQLVNEKYHDLKKMLGALKGQISQQELERVEDSVSAYDSYVHTGNKVLDVLLTEKQLLCEEQHITVTCFLGDLDFSFVEELDLYALFANALTNAMEAVSRLPEGQERFINLTGSGTGDLVVIHIENPCAEAVEFGEDGLPRSHGDSRYHGFGMRSMERSTEKYGGMLAAKQENGMFLLDLMLIPMHND